MKREEITRQSGRIMVIVPHQDDEVLLTAGILQQAVAYNLPVRVVMATNGDYGSKSGDYRIGRARLKETLKGLSLLPLAREAVTFLGYADTGMPEEESFLYRLFNEKQGSRILPSHCSNSTYGMETKPDYHSLTYGCPADYTRNNFITDLKACIAEFSPDKIFTTCAQDTHGDHSGLFHFIIKALQLWNQEEKRSLHLTQLYAGLVHSPAGDDVWPLRENAANCPHPVSFTCPPDFDKAGGLRWQDRIVFPVPDTDKKALMLSRHKTALKPDAIEFLYSFIKNEEIFWKIEYETLEVF